MTTRITDPGRQREIRAAAAEARRNAVLFERVQAAYRESVSGRWAETERDTRLSEEATEAASHNPSAGKS